MTEELWSIAVDAPINEALTYKTPSFLNGKLSRGQLVHIPLGKRKSTGVLIQHLESTSYKDLKEIISVSEEYPKLPEPFLRWLEWISEYYFYPIGSVAATVFPTLKKSIKDRASKRDPVVKNYEPKKTPLLSDEQKKTVEAILKSNNFSTHLLFGVTGSGKTEVYLRLLEHALKSGKKGLVLVPEISLTPQLIQRFAERFGNQVAVLHSQLTDRERTNQWWDIVEGRKSILIGARSALFCPIENLGIIVVDEEHEPSYKQEEKLKYHGRDAAVVLAKFSNCPIVLGSATPSLESWKNAQDGRYQLHQMKSRVEGRFLPDVQVIDLKNNPHQESKYEIPHWLSPQLYEAIGTCLEQKKQVALFLNRRGVAPLIICQDCGYTHQCPNCDINLTLHGKSHLVCHYCDYHENFKTECPDCKIGEIKPVGLGTEQLENEIQKLFPTARLARADRDEITNRLDLENLISQMESLEIDILIGTQMIAKGLDFPNLTLVGLILADVGFNIPDFRATERSFQLITQVSGRSGRHIKEGESAGKVLIQTFNPEHPSIVYAQKNDFVGFAELELSHRQVLTYPPFGKLISVRFQARDQQKVQEIAKLFSRRASQIKSQNPNYESIEVLGPAEAPLSRIRGQYRFYILLKGLDSKNLNKFCRHVLGNEDWVTAGVRILVDIDPLHLL